jgi:hypothetical protein
MTGSRTQRSPSAGQNTCSTIWPATRIAWQSRIIAWSTSQKSQVTFRWKDYLTHEEFLRRFLQHILPRGFPRIRYFGLFLPIAGAEHSCRSAVCCWPLNRSQC